MLQKREPGTWFLSMSAGNGILGVRTLSIAKAQDVGGYQGAVTPISFKGKGRNSMVYMKQRESPTCGHLVTVALEWGPEDKLMAESCQVPEHGPERAAVPVQMGSQLRR